MRAALEADGREPKELEIRPAEFSVLVDGRRLSLTARELRLLEVLAGRRDRVIAREELFTAAWGRPLRSGDRSVDVYVSRVRAKLEQALPDWRFIHTHFGFGYRFSPEPLHLFHNGATRR